MHWPELDEDISTENLLLGQPSGEGGRSFARWKEWYERKRNDLNQGRRQEGTPL
ncbi:MAG: hypothetical protein KDM81_10175 [Verrucomicrobiae bacterium]|nr:hypothetical protein [Verrucomicrobiae bacterium]